MSTPQHPPQFGWQPEYHAPPPPPPTKKASKVVLLVGVVLVLVAGGVAATKLIKTSPDTAATDTAGQTKDDGPPDQDVLVQKITSGNTSYGAMAAFDACAVLPHDALEKLGLKPRERGRWRHRNLPASVSAGDAKISQASQFEPVTACDYPVSGKGTKGGFTLEVLQTPFNSRRIATRPKEGETESSAAGLRVMTRTMEPGTYFATIDTLESSFTAELHGFDLSANYDGVPDTTMFAKVVEVVATNLAKGPVGRAGYAYSGRYERIPNACEVVDSALFATVTGESDSGLAEFEPSSLSESNTAYPDGSKVKSIEQKCTRYSIEQIMGNDGKGKTLTVALETFRTEERAKFAHQVDCDPDSPSAGMLGKPLPVNEKIGDGPPCVRLIDAPNYVFRVGRTLVHVHTNKAWSGEKVEPFASKFASSAKTIAEEVRKRY